MNLKKHSLPYSPLLLFVFIIGIIFGVKLYFSGTILYWKHFTEAVINNPIEVFENIIDKKAPKDTISIYINQKNKFKLINNRYKKLIYNKNNRFDKINASFQYKDKLIKTKIKLIGKNIDHFGHPSKWSLRFKLKQNNSFNGTKQFNLLLPHTRGYLFDYLINKIMGDFDIISIGYRPVQLYLNGNNHGIFLFEDFFNKYLIEKNQKKESIIFTIKDNKIDLNYPSNNKILPVQEKLITTLENKIRNLDMFIDEEKFIVLISTAYLFGTYHLLYEDNLHWYYNPHTNLLEPIVREVFPEGKNALDNFSSDKLVQFLSGDFLAANILNNQYLYEYFLKNKFNTLESEFFNIMNSISKKYEKYYFSDEFKNYHEILNNESIINNWVTKKGYDLIEKFQSNYSKMNSYDISKNIINQIDTIYFSGQLKINTDKIINENEFLIIKSGTNIIFENNADLIIYGGFKILGSLNQPVIIKNNDNTSSSILIINSKNLSVINYAEFINLSSYDKNGWINSSSITFYDSPAIINNSNFYNNIKGDDYLNIVRTDSFLVNQCTFQNIKSDAIDVDFSNGKISNSSFIDVGNDAIDFSGSTSEVVNCNIKYSGDKGISCGEKSTILIKNCNIVESKYGIVSKDLSIVNSKDNYFNKNYYDYGLYQKKAEFGSSTLHDKNSKNLKNVFLEDGSIFKTDNHEIKIITNQ